MNKKQITNLAKESFDQGKLNEKRVKIITARLKRPELKEFFYELQTIESKNIVEITLPSMPNELLKKQFNGLFQGKEIVYTIDASLFPGIRIQQGDLFYEVSLKNSLDKILAHLKESYD